MDQEQTETPCLARASSKKHLGIWNMEKGPFGNRAMVEKKNRTSMSRKSTSPGWERQKTGRKNQDNQVMGSEFGKFGSTNAKLDAGSKGGATNLRPTFGSPSNPAQEKVPPQGQEGREAGNNTVVRRGSLSKNGIIKSNKKLWGSRPIES